MHTMRKRSIAHFVDMIATPVQDTRERKNDVTLIAILYDEMFVLINSFKQIIKICIVVSIEMVAYSYIHTFKIHFEIMEM